MTLSPQTKYGEESRSRGHFGHAELDTLIDTEREISQGRSIWESEAGGGEGGWGKEIGNYPPFIC